MFFQNRSISFGKKTFFDFKNEHIIPVSQNGKLLKRWNVIAIQKLFVNWTLL